MGFFSAVLFSTSEYTHGCDVIGLVL